MDFNYIPKLQTIAYVQIAIPILNNPEMRYLIDCCQFQKTTELYNKIEKVAMEKLSRLILPTPLRKVVKNCIMNMFAQIMDCKFNHSLGLTTKGAEHINQKIKFIWKHNGTIDQENTVKSLITNRNLNIKERFELACNFCLISDALSIWKNMKDEQIDFSPLQLECRPLVKLWFEIFEQGSSSAEIAARILEYPCLHGNIFILRFVLNLIPFEQQRVLLLNIALKDDVNTNIMVYCLSHLEKSDQETIFKSSPTKVLQSMSNWIYQSMFLSVADYLWTYISEESYCNFIKFICNQIVNKIWLDFDLIELVKEFYLISPIHFQKYIEQHIIYDSLKILLNSDSSSFPLREFRKAYFQSVVNHINIIIS